MIPINSSYSIPFRPEKLSASASAAFSHLLFQGACAPPEDPLSYAVFLNDPTLVKTLLETGTPVLKEHMSLATDLTDEDIDDEYALRCKHKIVQLLIDHKGNVAEGLNTLHSRYFKNPPLQRPAMVTLARRLLKALYPKMGISLPQTHAFLEGELPRRKLCAHLFDLNDRNDFIYEGWLFAEVLEKTLPLMASLPRNLFAPLLQAKFYNISNMENAQEAVDAIQRGELVFLGVGWPGHSVQFVFKGALFAICNGGDKKHHKGAVQVFSIDPSRMSLAILETIKDYTARWFGFTSSTFFYEYLPKDLGAVPSCPLAAHVEPLFALDTQSAGNCSMFSFLIALKVGLIFLKTIENNIPSEKTLQEAETLAETLKTHLLFKSVEHYINLANRSFLDMHLLQRCFGCLEGLRGEIHLQPLFLSRYPRLHQAFMLENPLLKSSLVHVLFTFVGKEAFPSTSLVCRSWKGATDTAREKFYDRLTLHEFNCALSRKLGKNKLLLLEKLSTDHRVRWHFVYHPVFKNLFSLRTLDLGAISTENLYNLSNIFTERLFPRLRTVVIQKHEHLSDYALQTFQSCLGPFTQLVFIEQVGKVMSSRFYQEDSQNPSRLA